MEKAYCTCQHMKDIFQNKTKRNEIATTYLYSSIGDAVKIILNIHNFNYHKYIHKLLPILQVPSTF
jgi:hypothetical protein